MRLSPSVVALVVVAAVAPSLPAQQSICVPASDSHEANTFAILSVPVAFTGSRAPAAVHGGVTVGLELATLPTVDATDATPTSCRPGKGPENAHPVAGIVRPRVAVGVHGFVLEASWIPPVTVNEVKANLVGLAIARPFALGAGWYLGVRVHAVFGSLNAPVTCDDAALRDTSSECFGGTRSNDRWQPGVFGAEAVVGAGRGAIRPYLGVGYTMLRPRFQVDFTNAAGQTDNTQVNVNFERVALFGGVMWRIGQSSIVAEAYSTPADAVTARLVVRTLLLR
jgi:hypothetical protein